MNFRIKLLILALSSFVVLSAIPVQADTQTASNLVSQAIEQKSFCSYNNAYLEVLKLGDENEKNKFLGQLSTISNQVFSDDIKNIVKSIDELSKTCSSRIYDDVQVTINKANIAAVDKNYLLGEVCSWGKQLVWTDDYKNALSAVLKAWNEKTDISVNNAKELISKVKLDINKQYLLDEVKKINYVTLTWNGRNDGCAAEAGDYIYYSNAADYGKLYKIKSDGTNNTKLSDEKYVGHISVSGDWIIYEYDIFYYYYINFNNKNYLNALNSYGMICNPTCRIKVDGTCKEELGDHTIDEIIVGDTSYDTNGYEIYNSNAGTMPKPYENCSIGNLMIQGDWIYYSVNCKNILAYYKMKLDGTEMTLIRDYKSKEYESQDIFTYHIRIMGDWIYYCATNGETFRENLDGTSRNSITTDKMDCYNLAGDYLYYTSSGSLYKVKTDGTNKVKLTDGSAIDINIAGDWIYYYVYNNEKCIVEQYKIKIDGTEKIKIGEDSRSADYY